MTRTVFWDSSAILALLDADDADHGRAVSVARTIASEKRQSFITNYVEAEAHALLVRKLGRTIEAALAAGLLDGPDEHGDLLHALGRPMDYTFLSAIQTPREEDL